MFSLRSIELMSLEFPMEKSSCLAEQSSTVIHFHPILDSKLPRASAAATSLHSTRTRHFQRFRNIFWNTL